MKFLIVLSFFIGSFAQAAQVSSCSPVQTLQVRSGVAEATRRAQGLIDDISFDLRHQSLNNKRKFLVARAVLKCAKLFLPRMHWKCAQLTKDYEALTIIFTGRAWINRKLFFATDSTHQAATLLHEATHQCGTNDAAYFASTAPVDVDIRGWQSIADTYSYWAENGFCVPNKDCLN